MTSSLLVFCFFFLFSHCFFLSFCFSVFFLSVFLSFFLSFCFLFVLSFLLSFSLSFFSLSFFSLSFYFLISLFVLCVHACLHCHLGQIDAIHRLLYFFSVLSGHTPFLSRCLLVFILTLKCLKVVKKFAVTCVSVVLMCV